MATLGGNLSVEAQQRYAFIEKLLIRDVPLGGSVVELGSAPGDQIAQLARSGYQATSVDIGDSSSDAWGEGEEGRMTALLADAGVADIHWDLEDVPYPLKDCWFDAVIMTEVFEHLRDYPLHSLEQVRRILKPGGRLYFTTPNTAYAINRFRALVGKSTATPLSDWMYGVPHARHAREYTFSEIDTVMERAGLRIVSRRSRHFHVNSGRGGLARPGKQAVDLVSRAYPRLGPQIIVVAERPSEH